jgi:hypothetical protein
MVGSAEGQRRRCAPGEPCRALELIGEIVPSRRLETSIPVDSNLPVALLRQIFVKERRQLAPNAVLARPLSLASYPVATGRPLPGHQRPRARYG